MSDIRDLLRIYDVADAEREQLEELAIQARARPWWRDFSDIFENEFAGFENDASRIRVFMPLVLPGLLQTKDYAESFIRIGPRPPAWRRRMLDTRSRRQEILDRPGGTYPTLTAVITEASLRYQWGSRSERRDQIEHLVDVSRRPNTDLRIQRFTDGPPPGLSSAINIFDFAEGEPSIAFTETDFAVVEVSEPDQVSRYVESFEKAVDGALEPSDTAIYLRQLADQLE
jgi:hypothetical protein